MKTLKDFKIRASAAGSIMGIKGLGKTGEGYVQQWLKEQLYSRRKVFQSKYTQKGVEVEDSSIDFVAEQLGYPMLIKNEQYFENELMTGTPDIILSDTIIDVKNSWDCFTFPLFDAEIPNSDYYYQGQVYMALTNRQKYKLVYTLMDTPEHIIQREAFYFCKTNGIEFDEEILREYTERLTYGSISPDMRIKTFEFERNDEVIDKIINRVQECRKYIKTL
jgi:hypothetical protein